MSDDEEAASADADRREAEYRARLAAGRGRWVLGEAEEQAWFLE